MPGEPEQAGQESIGTRIGKLCDQITKCSAEIEQARVNSRTAEYEEKVKVRNELKAERQRLGCELWKLRSGGMWEGRSISWALGGLYASYLMRIRKG